MALFQYQDKETGEDRYDWTAIVITSAIVVSLVIWFIKFLVNLSHENHLERLDDTTLNVYSIEAYDSTISLYRFESKHEHFLSKGVIYTHHNTYQMGDTFELRLLAKQPPGSRNDGFHDTLLLVYKIEEYDETHVRYCVKSLQEQFISDKHTVGFVDRPKRFTVGDILTLVKK